MHAAVLTLNPPILASIVSLNWVLRKNNKTIFAIIKNAFFYRCVMKISDRQPKISDSLKISDFSDSLGVLQHPLAPPAIRLCTHTHGWWKPGRGASPQFHS